MSEFHDNIFYKAMEFIKHKRFTNRGVSNVYVIQKTDLEGNVIGEYYGMNLMTDLGMTRFFNNNDSFPYHIYIGNGSGSFDTSLHSLLSAITVTPSTTSDSEISYEYPLYYDEQTGLITCFCKYLTSYFDYDLTGINNPVSISEYGIGTSYNALWTHSWVYNIDGDKIRISKQPGERLTITTYLCLSYHESLITDGWEDGRYTVITTMERFFNNMNESNIYTYRKYNVSTQGFYRDTSSFLNNEIIKTTTLSTNLIEKGNEGNNKGYIDGFCQWSPGFITLELQRLEVPENFDVVHQAIMSNYTSSLKFISSYFGTTSEYSIPITDVDMENVFMYNYKTGEFDNEENFYNNPEHCYTDSFMEKDLGVSIHFMTKRGSIRKMWVYQNLRTEDPIIKVGINFRDIYVTNKYWDTSSWVQITDENVPKELQNSVYWITSTNLESLSITRQSDTDHFRIIPDQGELRNISSNIINEIPNRFTSPVCDNYELGWFAVDHKLCFPKKDECLIIGDVDKDIYSMTWDKYLLSLQGNDIIVTDTTKVDDNDFKVILDPGFSKQTDLISQCYKTKSNTGIFLLQSIESNECCIINLKSNMFIRTLPSKISSCIYGTDSFVYIDCTTNELVICECIGESINELKRITLEISDDIRFIMGHDNYVWIFIGDSLATKRQYCINIINGDITDCEGGLIISDINEWNVDSIDDIVIAYRSSISGSGNFYIKQDNPYVISDLPSCFGTYYQRCYLKYIRNKTLVLIVSTYQDLNIYSPHINIIDFGKFLHGYNFSEYMLRGSGLYIPYGESLIRSNNIIPLEHFLSHRLVGKTKTISTINNNKNISGKQWSLTVTNIPKFNGLPPGNLQGGI